MKGASPTPAAFHPVSVLHFCRLLGNKRLHRALQAGLGLQGPSTGHTHESSASQAGPVSPDREGHASASLANAQGLQTVQIPSLAPWQLLA
jgi:hypothetical protein